jgi:DnaJ-class molecular chaperone
VLPGDVIIVLKQQKHALFERRQNDLFLRKSITLAESLLGSNIKLLELDDTILNLNVLVCIPPQSLWKVSNHGMMTTDNVSRGDLYIEFIVNYPDYFTSVQIDQLRNVFPNHPNVNSEQSIVIINKVPNMPHYKDNDKQDQEQQQQCRTQ